MASKKKKTKRPTPAKEASGVPVAGAGNGGTVPPAEHRFRPGQSGNPKGRQTAGASVREWINQMVGSGWTLAKVKAAARDDDAPVDKRLAAERIIRALEFGDLADFNEWLEGVASLEELRERGINTEVVKHSKVKVRTVPVGDGATEEHIEREITLHDRAGADFDRIMDQTVGKPDQTILTKEPEGDVLEDAEYVSLMLQVMAPRQAWSPAILARYENGRVPGYPKPVPKVK